MAIGSSRKRTACAAVALAASALTLSVPAAHAAAVPASQPSWCGWTPANTSWGDPGDTLQQPLNLRTGQSTYCDQTGTITSTGWNLTIRCYTTNGAGYVWYYVDSPAGRGWVYSGDVFAGWDPVGC